MELSVEQASEEESSANVSETDDAGSVSVPVDDEGFETLAAEIREVLAELAQDKAIDAFRGEYEKLFNALEKSHKNEKRLNTKCQELASEIASKQASVDAANDKTEIYAKRVCIGVDAIQGRVAMELGSVDRSPPSVVASLERKVAELSAMLKGPLLGKGPGKGGAW